ncbi:MAG: immunoglobulin domain-containing protein [Clostridia bacterium]|nr:immunoglobulin domain-containing protein [Clostridia bacterium]
MKKHNSKWFSAALAVLLLLMSGCALAQGAISTTVVMRVSHMTQNAVVDAGEDLSIEVNIDGVEPDSYQWYFNDEAITGANQKVLNIVNAQPEDTGIYRLDAFDANGKMLVSMDIAARVIEKKVPQSGDNSMPVGFAFAGIALCGAVMALLLRRRAMA